MPAFYPTRNLTTRFGLPHALWFVRKQQQDVQGGFVKDAGTFTWDRFPEGTVYEIGRGPYYLTLADARSAIEDGLLSVVYTDDYNDEYQDYYICNLATNTPEVPADTAEAIA